MAFRLGISCFGGPIAHLGYFRDEYVLRLRWVDETTYADLIALFQFLPGPTSSELGISIGILRAGKLGGLAAWLGFTLPSATALTLFAYGMQRYNLANAPWVHGLQLVAVAVVAQAVWGMARQFLTDEPRIAIAIVTTLVLLFVPSSVGQVAVIVWRDSSAGGCWSRRPPDCTHTSGCRSLADLAPRPGSSSLPCCSGCPSSGSSSTRPPMARSPCFRAFTARARSSSVAGTSCSRSFRRSWCHPGWMTNDEFLAGYGAAQAIPGPLFTFSAFLGAARVPSPDGVEGAVIALVAIFLPGALLVYASLPFWNLFRQHSAFQRALSGINACVVGILLAALYLTIWTQTVQDPSDFGVVLVAFALLTVWKRPPWQVVIVGAIAGAALGWLPVNG